VEKVFPEAFECVGKRGRISPEKVLVVCVRGKLRRKRENRENSMRKKKLI
jgi:hypothetical protein